ncbi:MAG TPA: hypothetical protein VMJ75_12640, partial [Candidatus Acidoferrales bacterium]|nr:hypothetical protein [Candidatus Acidoferrales bacterium]
LHDRPRLAVAEFSPTVSIKRHLDGFESWVEVGLFARKVRKASTVARQLKSLEIFDFPPTPSVPR